MTNIEVLLIALGLAMDAFAVSIAAGISLAQVTPRHTFRLAFHFGLFQWLMPVVGYLAGAQLAHVVAQFDHWVAFVLLSFVGGKMLWESRQRDDDQRAENDPTRGLTLVTLSIATSLDALAVGFSMAVSGVSVWWPAAVIGLVACTLSALGITFGRRLGGRWEHWAEAIGGLVLIGIGVRLLISHLVQ